MATPRGRGSQRPNRRSSPRQTTLQGLRGGDLAPNHQIEATTREGYTYAIYRNIMPTFGSMRMIDILPEHVRAGSWRSRTRA
ncbi:hypothetical protein ACGFNU_04370 [Spirillospora sp. NPDC048911]|uniref:hypothetical protein n=1 Tax=Spirillospora sp. NPDC048911 TaxID=3364527 RepID=UPI003723D78B